MESKGEQDDDLVSLFGSASAPVNSSIPAIAVAAVVSRSTSSFSSSNRSRLGLFEAFSPLHDEGSVSTKLLDEFGDQLIPAPDFNSLNMSKELSAPRQRLGDEDEVVLRLIPQPVLPISRPPWQTPKIKEMTKRGRPRNFLFRKDSAKRFSLKACHASTYISSLGGKHQQEPR